MQIGIGLPNTLDVVGPEMAEWARRAEARGFACLSTIDRIVYPSYDSIASLAVAAGATSRIGLFPNILLTPVYPPVWLAKATASLHAMSGGRLTLGLGVGGRPDDFAAMDAPFDGRGKVMDQTLDLLRRAWAGENVTGDEFPVVPPAPGGGQIPTLVGGAGEAAIRRTVQYGAGWTAAGGGPEMAAPTVQRIRDSWRAAGREGEPRLCALVYYGLGDEDASRASLRQYYGWLGEWTEAIVEGAVRTPQAVRDIVRGYQDAGFNEIVFDPTVASLDEVDRLADVVL